MSLNTNLVLTHTHTQTNKVLYPPPTRARVISNLITVCLKIDVFYHNMVLWWPLHLQIMSMEYTIISLKIHRERFAVFNFLHKFLEINGNIFFHVINLNEIGVSCYCEEAAYSYCCLKIDKN